MMFAGPPEDDIDWADVSPSGSVKFLARAYRVADEVTSAPGADPASGDVELRKVTHRMIDEVTRLVEAHRFNVAIARHDGADLRGAARHRQRRRRRRPGRTRGRRDAGRHAVAVRALHRRGDVGAAGPPAPVATAGWPSADAALLVQESVTCVVQVAGKVRDRLEVAPDIAEDELERLALDSEKVQAALGDRGVRKVIVRAPKIVNIVPA